MASFTKSDKRVVLSFWQSIGHYSFVLIPQIPLMFEVYALITGDSFSNTFSISTYIFLGVVSILIGYLKWNELHYYEFNEGRNDDEFENAVLAASNKQRWGILEVNNKKVDAIINDYRRNLQKIKIERDSGKVLINIISDVFFLEPPDLFGANKKIRNNFLHYYIKSNTVENLNEKVIQELETERKRKENESEWTLKNILRRIIAYLVSYAFIAVAMFIMSFEGPTLLVLFFLILGFYYLVVDAYFIFTKNKKGK